MRKYDMFVEHPYIAIQLRINTSILVFLYLKCGQNIRLEVLCKLIAVGFQHASLNEGEKGKQRERAHS